MVVCSVFVYWLLWFLGKLVGCLLRIWVLGRDQVNSRELLNLMIHRWNFLRYLHRSTFLVHRCLDKPCGTFKTRLQNNWGRFSRLGNSPPVNAISNSWHVFGWSSLPTPHLYSPGSDTSSSVMVTLKKPAFPYSIRYLPLFATLSFVSIRNLLQVPRQRNFLFRGCKDKRQWMVTLPPSVAL